mgnify:CR=1 FL=1
MAAYIFVVDEDNFGVCVERGVCGCPCYENPRINARAIADVVSLERNSWIVARCYFLSSASQH